MTIKLPLLFKGSKGEMTLYALFDTGSTYSCISEDLAEKVGNLDKLPETRYFGTASENQYLKVENGMRLDFEINDINLTDEFMVVPKLSEEVIIGATTMQKWRLKLDFEHDAVIVDPKVAVIILKALDQCPAF
ncbi:MAG: retropepsin-like aspartic protease [Chitinophagaceae bacterium]